MKRVRYKRMEEIGRCFHDFGEDKREDKRK